MIVQVIFVIVDDINVWVLVIVNISKVFLTETYGNSYPEFFLKKELLLNYGKFSGN